MVVVMTMPRSRPLTVADLDEVPDDGHRYELVDGVLVVTPAPGFNHQSVVAGLFRTLDGSRPADMCVLFAPFDVVLSDDTLVQPDLLVAPRADFGPKNLSVPPLLAVEVLSPSTRGFDRLLKLERYARAGVASYWIVDPDELRLTVFELGDGAYAQVAEIAGDEEWTATSPYSVSITPSRLRD